MAWYVDGVEEMLGARAPLGVVSNIASWNYPYSVLVHAVLVQALCGNAVVAKTPTDGGLYALTVGFALARRAGLPVTLVSGSGGELGPALVRGDGVDCLAFVGGRSSGRAVAAGFVLAVTAAPALPGASLAAAARACASAASGCASPRAASSPEW